MSDLSSQEVICNTTKAFYVLDTSIQLDTSETAYGNKTFAIVEGVYHYLGDENIGIETAVNVYQYINNRMLSPQELQSVMGQLPNG